jgi:hypothetical protein
MSTMPLIRWRRFFLRWRSSVRRAFKLHNRMLCQQLAHSSSAPTSTILTVEVGGVAHLGHYSTRNGMIGVTYGSSCKATQLCGMENAPKALARIILAEQAREALGYNEEED